MRQRQIFLLAIIFVSSFVIFYYYRNPFLGQWDSFDYTWRIIKNRPSDLFLGRSYYIGYNALIWGAAKRIVHLRPEEAYKVIQLTTILLGSLALVVHFVFVRELVSSEVALLSTIFLMLSPIYVLYAGCILTEVPMVFFLNAGLAAYLHGLRTRKKGFFILGSSLIGFSVGIREPAVFFFPLLVILPLLVMDSRRTALAWALVGSLLALFVAAAGPIWFLATDYESYTSKIRHWSSHVQPNYHITLSAVKTLLFYTLINSPAAVVLTILGLINRFAHKTKSSPSEPRREIEEQRAPSTKLLVFFFFASVLPLLLLLPDPDLRLHPRYELPSVPGITIMAAVFVNDFFSRSKIREAWKRAFVVSVGLAVLLLASIWINGYNRSQRHKKDVMRYLLNATPPNAVFIAGSYTPNIEYYKQLHVRPDWRVIGSGWDWPKHDLPFIIKRYLREGRPTYLISDRYAWVNLEQERRDVEMMRRDFHFEKIAPELERLRSSKP